MNLPAADFGIPGLTRTDLLIERALIGGRWRDAASGAQLTVTNPADGARLGTVPACDGADTRLAIEAAETALPASARPSLSAGTRCCSKISTIWPAS